MEQSEVNEAITAFIERGDSGPWLRVLEAIRDGQVFAEPRTNTLTLTAITRPATAHFGQRLAKLRAGSEMTLQELADLLDISSSSVIRQFRGQVLGAWPVVSMMITALGGEPKAFKADHVAAKAEYSRGRRPVEITTGHGR